MRQKATIIRSSPGLFPFCECKVTTIISSGQIFLDIFLHRLFQLFVTLQKISYMNTLLSIIVFLAISTFCTLAAGRITVVSLEDNSPVASATVFSKTGIIIGITDDKGYIEGFTESDIPLTVRCLGFDPATTNVANDTVFLSPAIYNLSGITVSPGERPVLKALCHIREYNTGVHDTDTIQQFNEHMAHFYLPVQKVKKYNVPKKPFIRKSRTYFRHAGAKGDSIAYSDKYDGDISWMNVITMPSESVSERAAIRSGAKNDTVAGKYGIAKTARKNRGAYIEETDYLADRKDHRFSPFIFKLLGLTMDFNELRALWAYKPNETGIYGPHDLLYGTWNINILGKGKWFKKAFNAQSPVEMNGFYEIYILDFEYLTTEEAKEEADGNVPQMEFMTSPLASPLPPAVETLVRRCKASGADS